MTWNTDYTGDVASFVIDTGRLKGIANSKNTSIVKAAITGFDEATCQAIRITGNMKMLATTPPSGHDAYFGAASPFNAFYLRETWTTPGDYGTSPIYYTGGNQGVGVTKSAEQMKTAEAFEIKLWVFGGVWYGRIITSTYDSGDISTGLSFASNKLNANPFIFVSTISANSATVGLSIDDLQVFLSV